MSFTPAQNGQSTSLDTGVKEGRKGSLPIYRSPCPYTRASNDGCLNQGSRAYYCGPAAWQRLIGKSVRAAGLEILLSAPFLDYIFLKNRTSEERESCTVGFSEKKKTRQRKGCRPVCWFIAWCKGRREKKKEKSDVSE
jgi:hypothetical protein